MEEMKLGSYNKRNVTGNDLRSYKQGNPERYLRDEEGNARGRNHGNNVIIHFAKMWGGDLMGRTPSRGKRRLKKSETWGPREEEKSPREEKSAELRCLGEGFYPKHNLITGKVSRGWKGGSNRKDGMKDEGKILLYEQAGTLSFLQRGGELGAPR